MKFTKRFFALALMLCVLLTSAAFAEEMDLTDINGYQALDYRDYSQYPLSDGSDSLRITIMRSDTYGIDADEIWFWNWIQQVSGVNLEIEQIQESAKKDRITTMMASGDLPDIMWGLGFTPDQLVSYGMEEGLFAPLNDYVTNKDVMPNLASCIEYDKGILAAITCLDGNIYTLPGMRSKVDGESTRTFINKELLAAVGKESPKTLDEFIDVMYAFKEYDPEMTPLGGNAAGTGPFNPTYYIMNALGYLGEGYNDGTGVAIRNGEAVIPAADETFVEVLRVMHQFYVDGIISQDFYTLENSAVNAQMAEGKLGVYPFVPFTVNADPDFYDDWISVMPLTSEWNDTPQWKRINMTNVGGFVVSADCENVELAMRLVDFLYCPLGNNLSWLGPIAGTDYCLEGMSEGWYMDPTTGSEHFVDVEKGLYTNSSEYAAKVGCGIYEATSNNGVWPEYPEYSMYQQRQWITGVPILEDKFDTTQPDPFFRDSMLTYISPYERDGYPGVVYMTEDDVYALSDLKSVLEPYMKTEIAKFITGERDLSEYDAYLGELKSMGVEDYVQYYKTNYDNYMASQG